MNLTIRFTKPVIESLPAAESGKRDYYEDPRLNSLRLRLSVTDKGAKSWVVQRRVNGRVLRYTLGRFPDLVPEAAIREAEKLGGKIAIGEAPHQERATKEAQTLTLTDALDLMLKVRSLKPGTATTYRNLVKNALEPWATRPLASITPEQVADRHAKLTVESGGPYANSAMRTFRSIWNFAATQYEDERGLSLLPPNPVARLSRAKAWVRVARRKTYIERDQLAAWFKATQALREEPYGSSAQTVGDYLLVLILTGLRRTEAASLKWTDINLESRYLRLRDTKNHDEHLLPLSDFVTQLFKQRHTNAVKAGNESPYVFPAQTASGYLCEPRAHVERVIRESGVQFMLHDLRRTFSTVAEGLDLSHYALKRLLNHRMAGDVTAGYIANNVERLRAPMQQITDTFLTAAKLRPSKVTPIRRSRMAHN